MKNLFPLLVVLMTIMCACDDGQPENNGNNSNINNTNNTNNTNSTTTEPQFETPVEDPGLLFDVRGTINSYEALQGGTATLGLGSMTLVSNDEERYFTERLAVTDYAPGDGTELIVLTAIGEMTTDPEPQDNLLQAGLYTTLYVYLDKRVLLERKAAGEGLLWGTDIAAAVHVATNYYVREDGMRLYRRCNTFVDSRDSRSVVEVEYDGINTFAQGEILVTRGNVALSDDVTYIQSRSPYHEEDMGELCVFIIDGANVDKALFYEELSGSLSLTCALPETFFTTTAAESLRGLFTGEIVPYVGDGSEEGGRSSFDLSIGGESVDIDSVNSFAALDTSGEDDSIYFMLMGNYVAVSADHIFLTIVTISMERAALVTGAASGLTTLTPEQVTSFVLYDYDYKESGTGYSYRICPKGAPLDATALGELAFCNTGNSDFSVGEPFELALNIPLTSDASTLAVFYGLEEPCSCVRDASPIDCNDF